MIELRNISKFYFRGNSLKKVISSFSGIFESASLSLIKGLNASGKTTLLRIISLNLKQDEGEIYVKGEYINRFDHKAKFFLRETLISFSPQIPFFPAGISCLHILKILRNIEMETFFSLSSKINFPDKFMMMEPGKLSAGFRKKFSLLLCLSRKAEIFVLDEPFSNLDEESQKALSFVFQELVEKDKKTLIISSPHDLHYLNFHKIFTLNVCE